MDSVDKITYMGIIGFILLGIIIVIFNKFTNSRLVLWLIGGFIYFWMFFIMLKQNEANCDKTGWSDEE